MSFRPASFTPGPVNCSDPAATSLKIFTPISTYAATAFSVYFLPMVVIIGIVGNSLSLVILDQAAKKVSSHFYLWSLAIFDIISLISYMPSFWVVIILRVYHFYLWGPNHGATWIEYYFMTRGFCEFRMFFTFTARTCSTYAVVLVTLERFIMVMFPMKGHKYCTMRTAKIATGIMIACACVLNLPWFFAFNTLRKPCFPNGICVANNILVVNRLVEFICICLVPSVIIIVCNICIIVTIKRRQKLNILVNKYEAKKQERIITTRLLSVSFVFFFLTMPSLVVVSIHTSNELRHDKSHLSGPMADAFVLSIVLFAVNLAVNFVIYCLTGKHFREAVWYLLRGDLAGMRRCRRYLINETSNTNDGPGGTDRIEMQSEPRPSIDYPTAKLLSKA